MLNNAVGVPRPLVLSDDSYLIIRKMIFNCEILPGLSVNIDALANQEHEEIAAAIISGNFKTAPKAMHQHIESSLRRISPGANALYLVKNTVSKGWA